MSQTIRRKPAPARKIAARNKQARNMRNAKARTGSMLDAVMDWLPFSEDQLHKLFLVAILAVAAITVVVVARLAGIPDLMARQMSLAAADAGFEVAKVEVRGVKHLNELKVYERVQSDIGAPMTELDVDRIRAELVQLSWVADARVSRQLPDRLVIDIVERVPHAVLRKADKLVLIDASGNELEPISPERAKGKLVVSGPGAGKQVTALTRLLEAAPALKPQVGEAEWIGNRRWNLTFNTGQVLALPEGDKLAAGALMSFARLDGVNRLLGGRATAFDMRSSDRIFFRLPDRTKDEPTPAGSIFAKRAVGGQAAPAKVASADDGTPAPKSSGAAKVPKPAAKKVERD